MCALARLSFYSVGFCFPFYWLYVLHVVAVTGQLVGLVEVGFLLQPRVGPGDSVGLSGLVASTFICGPQAIFRLALPDFPNSLQRWYCLTGSHVCHLYGCGMSLML